ncbi:superinfection immunity protein [Pseudomonas sp. KSR10]|uniref:superinfection immunity protein n=1 Tax=Pseudomonas sp. KSR10 TaxID=2916654 RepID=UPI001EF9A30F|nr:superinfection immunity protein [Pseudomonas sp. KSR10]MCG6540167.1 superinfection immunity protein [Pseudomonas sp. KSR10]
MEFVLLALAVALYFVPTIVASMRNHANAVAITALNLLLGWTLIGWVAALVWSLTAQKQANA